MFFKKILLTIFIVSFSASLLSAQLCVDGDCLNGKGALMDKDSNILVGHFENGKLEGQGVCYYSWGAKYVGKFKQGSFEGQGAYYQSNGTVESGLYKNGLLAEAKNDLPNATPTKVKAIIVGINEYATQQLRFTVTDAETISNFLTHSGASVTSIYNQEATVDQFSTTLDAAVNASSSDETIMFFFFGVHQNQEIHLADGTLPIADIQRKLDNSQAAQVVSFYDITDAEEQLMAMKKAKSASLDAGKTNSFSFFLEKQNEYSIEYDGLRYGLYTHYLMQALKGAADADLDGQVSQQELFSFTSRQLRDYTDGRLFLQWQQDGTANSQYIPLVSQSY